MGRLTGKVAVITGSSSGIGAATARLFAREGAKVVVVANHNAAGAQQVVDSIRAAGSDAVFAQADVAREADCRRIMDTAVATFGRLDILVNNAGTQSGTPTTELTEEEFDHMMAVNVKSVFFCCKYAIPYMKQVGGGSIVTTSSRAAFIPTNVAPIYCATKAAAASWTQAVALEHAADGIRANSIFPGNIRDTNMSDGFISSAPDPAVTKQWFETAQPIGRSGTPEDCAHAILFLASDEAAFITNAGLLVDGGLSFS
jgi:meso-butanediol dehydrogenase / (S,S)-butanediol dehydrogenase / diacetyl reductase